MLEELKKLNYFGGKAGILFFLCDVIGNKTITIQDIKVICSHAPGRQSFSAEELVDYCYAFGWIEVLDNSLSVSPSLIGMITDKEGLNKTLIYSTVNQLFIENIFDSEMFFYDAIQCCYAFRNELLPLSMSCVRNVLISQGFLIPKRDLQGARFYISPEYDALIAKHCKARRRQMSLDKLKEQLEKREIAGENAELFVLAYEKERLGEPLCNRIKRISEIDVAAGYDIVSFNSECSLEPDRFIEVKAASREGFFWSKNEYEIALLKGDLYYLYLVELSKIHDAGYSPEMIKNPAANIMNSDRWYIEAQSYHVKQI